MTRQEQLKLLDNLRRKTFIKYEIKKKILYSIIKNSSLQNIYRYYAYFNFVKISRYSLITKQKNRCTETGRSWSVEKSTKYSRFVFRDKSNTGNLPGFKRASW